MLTGDQIEKMLTRMADKLEGEALQELTLILTEVATIIVDEEIKRHKLEGAAEVSISTIAELLHKLGGQTDRKSTRLNSSHIQKSRMPSSA